METKRNSFNHFLHPRFVSGYERNQLFTIDVSRESIHQGVPKLMIFVPKWDERTYQRKFDKSFYKLLDTNSRMPDSSAESNWMVPKARKVAKTALSICNRWWLEQKVIVMETSKTNA